MPISDRPLFAWWTRRALAPGSDFGPRYRIESLLGQGGMGRVYKAYDKTLDRTVAIKVVRQGVMGEAGRFSVSSRNCFSPARFRTRTFCAFTTWAKSAP